MKLTKKILELVDEADIWINAKSPDGGGKTIPAGLVMHYSTENKEWQAYYGKSWKYYKATAPTLEEALMGLIDNLENQTLKQDATS